MAMQGSALEMGVSQADRSGWPVEVISQMTPQLVPARLAQEFQVVCGIGTVRMRRMTDHVFSRSSCLQASQLHSKQARTMGISFIAAVEVQYRDLTMNNPTIVDEFRLCGSNSGAFDKELACACFTDLACTRGAMAEF